MRVPHPLGIDHLADAVGGVSVPRPLGFGAEGFELDGAVLRAGIGHRRIERDLALGQRLEDLGREVREAQSLFHDTLAEAEALGQIGGAVVAGVYQRLEGEDFVDRRHGALLQIFGKR